MNFRHSCVEQEHNTWIMIIEKQSSSTPLPPFHIFINTMMMNPADKTDLFAFACLQRLMTNAYWHPSVYITWNQNKKHICGACSKCSKERASVADSSVWYRTWRHWITVSSMWCVQRRLEIINCGFWQQLKPCTLNRMTHEYKLLTFIMLMLPLFTWADRDSEADGQS